MTFHRQRIGKGISKRLVHLIAVCAFLQCVDFTSGQQNGLQNIISGFHFLSNDEQSGNGSMTVFEDASQKHNDINEESVTSTIVRNEQSTEVHPDSVESMHDGTKNRTSEIIGNKALRGQNTSEKNSDEARLCAEGETLVNNSVCKKIYGTQDKNTCRDDEFACGDWKNTCVSSAVVCDGFYDCPNSRDEKDDCSVCANPICLRYSEQGTSDCTSRNCPAVVWTETSNTTISWFWSGLSDVVTLAYRPLKVSSEQNQKFSSVTVPSSDTTVTVRGLVPSTEYMFVFLERTGSKLCPLRQLKEMTMDGIPSAPEDFHYQLKILHYGNIELNLFWNRPKHTRGKIVSFFVYKRIVDKDLRSVSLTTVEEYKRDSVNVTERNCKERIDTDYVLVMLLPESFNRENKYEFWVIASTAFGMGLESKKLIVDVNKALPDVDLKVIARTVSKTSASLTWTPDPNALSYVIVGRSMGALSDFTKTVAGNVTSLVVDGLCPGWPANFTIQPKYNVSGAKKYFSNQISLKGKKSAGNKPVIFYLKVKLTGPTSARLTFASKTKSDMYYIYYQAGWQGYKNILKEPEIIETSELGVELKGLNPYEYYSVAVAPADRLCAISKDIFAFHTQRDDTKPPGSMSYHLERGIGGYSVVLTLVPFSPVKDFGRNIKPKIEFTKRNPSGSFTRIVTYAKIIKFLDLELGEHYIFSARNNVTGAEETKLSVKLPETYGPTDLRLSYYDVGVYHEDWKIRMLKLTWTSNVSMYKCFKQFKVITYQRSYYSHEFHWVNHFINLTMVNELDLKLRYGNYKFEVVAISEGDETTGISEPLEFRVDPKAGHDHYYSPPLQQNHKIHINKKLFYILIPIGLIIIFLSVGLVYYLKRKKNKSSSIYYVKCT